MSALLLVGQTAPLLGNPTGGDVVAGAATMGSAGSTLTVNQSTQNAIINWQTFSIANGETTKFVVPNLGATLNRMVGGNPSAIYGTLQSNGTLYLVNPSGIVVGASGRIDTASFLASTLDVSNEQFLKGGALNFAGSSDAAIDNSGTIHAATGDVYLIANQVNNNGTLSAPQGTVGLAAGNDVIFQQAGSQNLFVQATPVGTKRALGVTNAGTIHAAAAELTAAGGNAYALAINNTGVIAATGYKKVNGQVYLTSDGGSIGNSGTISAKQAQGNGGTIVIDGTAKNSTTSGTVMNSGTLDASATKAGGSGGTITLKNMGGTVVHSGKLLARGGTGGKGGNAEISGATVGFTGAVDLRSFNGTMGNLLLDPATVNIVTGGGSNLSASTIDPSALVAALDGANVTLTGTTSIKVSNLVDASDNGSPGNLTLTTPTLTLNAPIILAAGSVLSGSATAVTVGANGLVQNAVDAASSTTTPTINLASGATYKLTSQILIDKSLTLDGNNAILDGSNGGGTGNGVTRVMEVKGTSSGIDVTLNSLTLENGNSSGLDDNGYGGGLLVDGYNGLNATVSLAGSTVTGNTSSYDGGGIYNDGQYGNAALIITGSTISNNTAGISGSSNGGGIANAGYQGLAAVTISANTTLAGNSAPAFGAGVYNYYGGLTLGVVGDATTTVGYPIYSTGTGATISTGPSVNTVNVNAPVLSVGGSTTSSTASTVNVGAGSGLENGSLVQGGLSLAESGGTVNLTAGTTYNLDATTGEIVIDQNLTLNGNGASIDGSAGAGSGNGTTRVMEIDGNSSGVTVNLNNVTLKNGNGADLGFGSSSGVDNGYGGGLLVYGYNGNNVTVNLTNSTVSGNTAANDGGGIYVEGDYGYASLTISGSTIANNTAGANNSGAGGGGIYSEGASGSALLTLAANDSITGNSAPGNGSGVFNYYGAMTLGVAGNTAMTVAYPIYSTGSGATITVAPSVATLNVNASVLNVSGSTVTSSATTVNIGAGSGLENGAVVQGGINLAAPGATVNLTAGTTYNLDATTGEIVIDQNLTLNGNGAILDGSAGAGSGNGTTRVMEIDGNPSGVTVNLNNVTLKNGNGADLGFGASGGTDDGYGGGLLVYGYNGNHATVNLTDSTVSGNTSPYDGGGIYVEGDYGNASLTISGSTIANNTAGLNYTGASGGGIYSEGFTGTATVTVTGSTLTGNSAPGNGAGIASTYGTLNLDYTGSTATIDYPVYLTNSTTLAISPGVTTLNLNAAVTGINGSTLISSATTINVGAVSGTESGYVVLSALDLLSGNGTVNLSTGATYNFDATTGGLFFNGNATVTGNGATLNGQGSAVTLVTVNSGATVTLGNLTITGASGAGLYNSSGGTLTVNGVTVSGNGGTQNQYYTEFGYGNAYGGIYNNGTLQLGAGTTVTGNTGYYTGGIYNDSSGIIDGLVTNAQVYGNTATQGAPESEGSDLYNVGTGTYEYTPDGGTGTTATITGSAYSSGANAEIAVDPRVTTLVVNAPVNIYSGATVTSTVPVVNIGPGSGTNNASLIQGGVSLTASGGTVNLSTGTPYYFDNTTSNLEFNGTVTVAGHGATLNGQSDVFSEITVNSGADVTLGNMTITGAAGVGLYNGNGGTLTLNGVTITGNGGTQYQYYNGYGYGYPYGGIYNNGTLQLGAGTTVTGNTGYYTGGIYNDSSGVIDGVITTAQVHGNTATQGTPASEGTDFYNLGTGTFEYLPDGGTGTTATLNGSTYSYGAGTAILLDPSVTTLDVNAPVNIYNNASVSGSAATVNIGPGSVANNAGLIQGGVALAASGATVNLTAGTTYLFDGSTGEIKIGQSLTLNGNGAILDGSNGAGPGNGVTRVMEIDGSATGVTVNLNHVTLENGNSAGPGAINGSYYGGALYIYAENGNQATVTMNNSTVSGSTAYYGGGGIYIDGYNSGNAALTLNNSTITGNSVTYYNGGGIFNDGSYSGSATLTVNNTTISGNSAPNGYGGAVYNNGTSGSAVLAGTADTVTGNTGYENGGIYNSGTISAQIKSTHLYGNTATDPILANDGADFYNIGTGTFTYEPDGGTGTTATINAPIFSTGPGAAIVVDPVITTLNVNAPVTSLSGATVTSSALTANVGLGSGTNNGGLIQGAANLVASGGVVNLPANATYELDNSSGGILIGQSLTLNGNGATIDGSAGAGPGNGVTRVMEIDGTVAGVTVTLNHLTVESGNASGLGANSPSNGGGLLIYAENGNQATVTINNSTFSGNVAPSYYGSGGGGINNDGSNGGNATLTLNNCTLTGNSANYYYYSTGGGAIFNNGTSGTATLTVNGGTITGNSGYVNGGIYNTGTILGTITNTQVYGNTVTDTTQSATGADFYNTGTGTFVYKPDSTGSHTATIDDSLYSSGAGAVITIDPSVTTLDINAPVTSTNGATVNGSATTVNIGPGTGNADNGFLIQSGITLASDGATVNLAPATTYTFDGSTGGVTLDNDVTLDGNGDTLDGQNMVSSVIAVSTGQNVTVNNLTAENGSYGVSSSYYSGAVSETLNNVTLTDNSYNGLSNYNYYSNSNAIVLNNCTITNNGSAGNGTAAGIYNYYNGTITLNNCTIAGNGSSTSSSYAGGIVNSGTLTLDSATTVTGNTGLYAGGIYNNGTILGNVTSTQVHGNTSVSTDFTNSGTDFYNSGTATFVYKPDGEGTNFTITNPIYSSGTGAAITLDPSITGTLNLNAQFVSDNSATFTSSATTVNVNAPVVTQGGVFNSSASLVNVAAGTGTENGYYVQAGVNFAGSGATVNLAPGTTYDFDNTTGGLSIANNLTLEGNGSTFDGQGVVYNLVQILPGGQTVTLNNLTAQNGYFGIVAGYYTGNLVVTLNNVTATDNIYTGIYNYDYASSDTLNLNNCTISNNGSPTDGSSAGIDNSNYGTINLTNCTISGNTSTYIGGITNAGTLSIDAATTVTGNTGNYTGGIYNTGTLLGTVTSSHVHGNTATNTDLTNTGSDFYNNGTGTFVYEPDGEPNHSLTISEPIYSSGANAVITIDPSLTGTLNLDSQFSNIYGSTFNSSATTVNVNAPVVTRSGVFNSAATTVNVAAGSGTENGYYVQTGLAFAASGATVNLAAGTTYNFDGTTSGLTIANGLTLQGNGAILNGQDSAGDIIDLANGSQDLQLNNLTVENGNYGVLSYVASPGATETFNNVTVTGNSYSGIYTYNYGYANTLNLNNCTISNNGTSSSGVGGIYNYYSTTVNLTNCTIAGNGEPGNQGTAGGILNYGTLSIDSSTTVTGNTGFYAGGIYNAGTILGTVTSSQVHGNTATNPNLADAGSDFYNSGTGTFVYKPDGEGNNLTIANPIYSSGSGAVITLDPSLTGTLNLNTPFANTYGATFNSSATTVNVNSPVITTSGIVNSAASMVNVAAGSGTESGYNAQTGVAFAGSGATVNLAAGVTYYFDTSTGHLGIGTGLTLQGNGAVFDAQGTGIDLIDLTGSAQTVAVNNLTLQNGFTGIGVYTTGNGLDATFNHVTVTGNSYSGVSDFASNSETTLNLVDSTISNNGTTGSNVGGIYNYYSSTINLTGSTITGNGNSNNPATAGGITNYGTLSLDTATTVTGNTGSYTGGIYNYGTILGPVISSQLHGNTATSSDLTNVGTDFYNLGTGTFIYEPDGEPNHNLTIATPIYSSGGGAVITIAPSLTGTLIVNSPFTSTNDATFNSSATTVSINAPASTTSGIFNSAATTVNVAAGSGTENGTYAQTGVALAGSGATVNLASGATYNFDTTTSGLTVNNSVILQGNGATLDGQGTVNDVLHLSNSSDATETVSNLTVTNGSYGVAIDNNFGDVTATLNHVTITGNSYAGLYNENYSDNVTLNNCTITNNGTTGSSGVAAGVFNYSDETLTLSNCTISNNGSATNAPTAGGLSNYGTLILKQTAITGNTGSTAGGIYNLGTLTATDCTFSGNAATTAGADLYNTGTYTAIADSNAAIPNTIDYATTDYNGGTEIYLATTINWNKAFTNHGTLTLDPTMGSVTINEPIVNSGGTLLIQAPVITLNASISSTQGNIVLVDTQQFVNNDGANALSATNGYTWQVWSVNPPTSGQAIVDQDGGLTPDFIQYDATYGVTSPASSGNGLLYSDTVGLQVALTGVATKVYDGTTTLTLAPATYSLNATGALNGDTVSVSSSSTLTGTLNSKNVDTANTATFDPSQVNFNVVSQNGVAVYGYTLEPFSAPASVTPVTVTASLNFGVPELKTYDGTTTATLASNGYFLNGVVSGDSLSLSATSGTYSDPHVGASKLVTYTGLALTPNGATDASDYTLGSSSLSGNIGTINPATLVAGLTGTVLKTYDATTTATLNSGNYTLSGVLGTDTVTLNDPTTGTYDTPNVGTGKTVTVTGLAISGSSASDYTLASTTVAGPVGEIDPSGVQMSLTGTLGGTITKVYDGTTLANNLTPANYTLTGVMPGDTVILSGPTTGTYASASVGTGILVTSSPGLSLSGPQAGNYVLTNNQASGNIGIITPATLTITANNASKTYNALPYGGGNGVSYSGFQGTDGASVLTGTLTYSGSSQGAVNAGTYTITPSGYSPGNYTYVYNSGTLTVSQAALTVTANNLTKVYGAFDPSPTYTVTGLLGTDTASVISSVSLTTTTGAAATAGTHPIVTSTGPAQNYAITDVNGTLTVTPATLTVTANNDSKTYDTTAYSGDTQGVTYSGFQYTDSAASLPGTLTYSGTSQGAVHAGTYTITPGGYTAGNYTYIYNSGNLTINPATLTAGLTGTVAKTYDATTTATLTSGNYTLAGVLGTDTVTLNDPATGSYDTPNVGTGKTVTVTGLAISGTNASDYTLASTIAAGPVGVINAAAVQMSLTGTLGGTITKVYDGTTTADNLTPANYTLTGVMPGDTVILNGPTTGTYASASVGSGILVTSSPGLSLSGPQAGNYVLTNNQASGNIGIITPATLTITANNASKTYNALPYGGGNGVSYSGFQGTDGASVLTGTLTYSGTSQGAVNAGTYAITPSGYSPGNYTYVYNSGTLTVGQAALTVTANNQSKVYGAADPTLTFGVTGLVGSDTASVLSGVSLNTVTGTAATAGTHPIITTGGTAQNYTVADANGTLTVSPATLTITANNDTKTYDATPYSGDTQGVTYSGFQYTDTAASLPGTLTYSGTSQGAVNVGTYAITPGGYSAGNYTYVYAGGNLAITPAPLIVTANSATTTYSATPYSGGAGVTYSGLKGADTGASLPGTLTYSGTSQGAVNVGTYTIAPGGYTAGNYTYTYHNGTLTIDQAPLTISVTDTTITPGSMLPAFNATYTGFVGNDTVSILNGTLTYQTTAPSTAPAGVYPVTASGVYDPTGNYLVTFVDGTLTIANPVITTTPSTTTGGAASAGSNLVPPVLAASAPSNTATTSSSPTTPQPSDPTPATKPTAPTTGDSSSSLPPPISFVGAGTALPPSQDAGGLASASSNTGQVATGDIAQISDGQLNNVANPHASGIMNQALGPVVRQNLSDALQISVDWTADASATGDDTADNTAPLPGDTGKQDQGETILTGGDVAEMNGTGVKSIPLSQAPIQLRNAMNGDMLKGMAASH